MPGPPLAAPCGFQELYVVIVCWYYVEILGPIVEVTHKSDKYTSMLIFKEMEDVYKLDLAIVSIRLIRLSNI